MPTMLELTGVSKTFDGIRVLYDVTLAVRPGEILGLIGENGSGKSTLIKILSGYHAPDPGARVVLGDRDLTHALGSGTARTAMAFIHQDLALVSSMTVLENLRIARFATGLGWRIRWGEERRRVQTYVRQAGLDVHPDTRVADLSVTEQALVAIARGLADIEENESQPYRLLVLDEPTAYLPHDGVQRLFNVLRGLTEHGTSIIFVSHRLDEVRELCDRVAVLRGGELVGVIDAAGNTERDLVQLMLGQPAEELYPPSHEPVGTALLEVTDLAGGAVANLSFTARPGEIVGFAGLPGSGYDEVPYLTTGARPARSGRIALDGRVVEAAALTPRAGIALGMALLPADRAASGCAPALSMGENMTLPSLSTYARLRSTLISRSRELRAVEDQTRRLGIVPARPELALRFLSGGNQQKVMLAKWLLAGPRVLALHEPTQGVDVGAKHDIFAQLSIAAESGSAILMSTVEHEDLARLCARVHVLRGGRCVRVLERGELTPARLAQAVYAG